MDAEQTKSAVVALVSLIVGGYIGYTIGSAMAELRTKYVLVARLQKCELDSEAEAALEDVKKELELWPPTKSKR